MSATKPSLPVGVLGLGIIGSRVARLIAQAGHDVWVWNRTPRPVPRSVGHPSDLAGLAETLLLFVKDGPAVMTCLEQMAPALSPRHIIVNHATIAPGEARAAADFLHQRGCGFLNAPFTGSRDAASAAQLVYYTGGEPALLEKVRPILETSARTILHVGSVEAAATVKLAANLMVASITASLAEAWHLVEQAGVSGEVFQKALENNAARSGISDLKLPSILAADYEPRFSLDNMVKDINLVDSLAETAGFSSLQAKAFLAAAAPALARDLGQRDFSVIASPSQ